MRLQRLISLAFEEQGWSQQSVWFKRLLYLLCLYKGLYLLFHFDDCLGANHQYYANPREGGRLVDLAFWLYNRTSDASGWIVLTALFLCLVFLLFSNTHYYVPELVLWLLMLNIHNKMYASATAGDYLLNQFLFFNVFIRGKGYDGRPWLKDSFTLMHNFGCVAVMVQVCVMYFFAGLVKAMDAQWLSGEAMQIIWSIRHFSPGDALANGDHSTGLSMFTGYGVMMYQIGFPLLIWWRPLKKPLLWLGIAMHVYIALYMGLVFFALTVMLGYVLFWPVKQTKSMKLRGED